MERAYEKFFVYVENYMEQKKLMEILTTHGYHWLSGHVASDIPVLLRLSPNAEGQILSIDPKNKKISFVPMEVISPSDDLFDQILDDAITLKEVMENKAHLS